MPRQLERQLVVAPIPTQTLTPVLAGERPGQFPLEGPFAEYAEWDLVSHSFEVQDDGSAILTAIFETRVQRSGSRRQVEGSSEEPTEDRREQRRQERQRRKEEERRQQRRGG